MISGPIRPLTFDETIQEALVLQETFNYLYSKDEEGCFLESSNNCKDITEGCGVYAIYNKEKKTIYIGSSVHIYKRLRCHILNLRRGTHDNSSLQKD